MESIALFFLWLTGTAGITLLIGKQKRMVLEHISTIQNLELSNASLKKTENELEESQKHLKTAQKAAKIANWEMDLVNNRLYWQDEICELFGIDPIDDTVSYETFISMINLQEFTIKDENILEAFRKPKNRIKAMALIHERLYRSEDLSSIELTEYIRAVAVEIFHNNQVNPKNSKLEIDAEKIRININQAVPCGLLINELITNACKYAFPKGWDGKGLIKITVLQREDNTIELRIADNGVGLPEDFDIKKVRSLGLRLVPRLVKQLKGKFELNRSNGTEFIINFMKQE